MKSNILLTCFDLQGVPLLQFQFSSSILTVHFTKLFSLFNIYCLTEDENNLFLHLLSSSYQKGLDPPVLQVIVKHRTACKNEKSHNKKVHAMIHTSGFLTKFSVTLPFHLETRLVPRIGTKSKDQNQNVSLYQYQGQEELSREAQGQVKEVSNLFKYS